MRAVGERNDPMDKNQNEASKKPGSSKDKRELLKNFKLTRKAIVAGKGDLGKRPKQAVALTVPTMIIRCGWGCAFGRELPPTTTRIT
jgi:hypothetical protein